MCLGVGLLPSRPLMPGAERGIIAHAHMSPNHRRHSAVASKSRRLASAIVFVPNRAPGRRQQSNMAGRVRLGVEERAAANMVSISRLVRLERIIISVITTALIILFGYKYARTVDLLLASYYYFD